MSSGASGPCCASSAARNNRADAAEPWMAKRRSHVTVRWQGIIEAYRDRLPVTDATPVVTLCEGNTPLVDAPRLSDTVGARVMLKVEGANPTGSFKDRGMTMAMSK